MESKNPNCAYGHWDCMPCTNCNAYIPTKTNADRIRAMSDEELANFMTERNVNEYTLQRLDKGNGLTAVQIEAIKSNIYCALMQWLKQPAEGEEHERT